MAFITARAATDLALFHVVTDVCFTAIGVQGYFGPLQNSEKFSLAAELFWDRPSVSDDIVSVDVLRNGVSVGTNFGTSFFDGTRAPNSNQTYQLLAIDSYGERIVAADIGRFELAKLDTGAGDAAFGNCGHVVVSVAIDGNTLAIGQ